MKKPILKLIKKLCDDCLFYEQEYRAVLKDMNRYHDECMALRKQLEYYQKKRKRQTGGEQTISEIAKAYKELASEDNEQD